MAKMGKGADFERTMCKEISQWWTDGERDDIFWRTAQSGGRATSRWEKGKSTAGAYGDMMATDESGKPFEDAFLVEFKKGYSKELGVLSIIDMPVRKKKRKLAKTIQQKKAAESKIEGPLLVQWWIKNEKIRLEAEKPYSLLIFKRDYRNSCIVVNSNLIADLEDYAGEICRATTIDVCFTTHLKKLVILTLSDFFNWCSAETMKQFIGDNRLLWKTKKFT